MHMYLIIIIITNIFIFLGRDKGSESIPLLFSMSLQSKVASSLLKLLIEWSFVYSLNLNIILFFETFSYMFIIFIILVASYLVIFPYTTLCAISKNYLFFNWGISLNESSI